MEDKLKRMEPIIITPKTEQEYSFVMEMLKRMKIKAAPFHEKPITRMTMQQYREMIDISLAEAREGRAIPHEEVKRQVAQWR